MEQGRAVAPARPLAGVVLAAGESRRMGVPKMLLPFGNDTILGSTLANAMAGGISPLTVVGGAYAAETAAVAAAKGLQHLLNEDYTRGQSSSLITGLAAVPPGYGMMCILGDQPMIPPGVFRALAAAYANSQALIVVPQGKDGRRGHPVIFAPQLFADIRQLNADIGARSLLEKYKQQILMLPVTEEGIYLDIDTPDEYERYCRILSGMRTR